MPTRCSACRWQRRVRPAASLGIPLYKYLGGPAAALMPVPMMNVINGGKHAEGGLQFQECMIVPLTAPSMAEAIRCGAEVFAALGKTLHDEGQPTLVGDEGGYAPRLDSIDAALALLVRSIERAGYAPGTDVAIALDAAATEFYRDGKYFPHLPDHAMDAAQMVALYEGLCKSYPVISIENGLAEDDWDGWSLLTRAPGCDSATRRRRFVRNEHQALSPRHRRALGQRDLS